MVGLAVVYFLLAKLIRDSQKNTQPSNEILEYLRQAMETVRETNRRQDQMGRAISENLSKQNKDFVSALQKNTSDLNERLDKAATVIGGVQKNLGEMSELGRAMKDLHEYLQNPKLRGNIGEQVLAQVLSQMLPKEMYALQYSFKSGDKVDAIIRLGKVLVPIDAKFPMENFRLMMSNKSEGEKKTATHEFERDVKKHIKAISQKYILENEGTCDYALMYIPSESVYYEVINSNVLFDYANEMRILTVSPMSFYAYLKAIIMSFQGTVIQKQAKEILRLLQGTRNDYAKLEEALSLLERHFSNAFNQLGNVNKHFSQLGQKLESTKMLEEGK